MTEQAPPYLPSGTVTHCIVAIDPGQTGAVAIIDDGVPVAVHDMPVMARRTKGLKINGAALARLVRDAKVLRAGASMLVVLEQASAMPGRGEDGPRGMGATSAFNFGEGFGIVQGVMLALHAPLMLVYPQTWKKYLGLTGASKDAARTRAIEIYPALAETLKRKKDIGRADAVMIGRWAHLTEQRT